MKFVISLAIGPLAAVTSGLLALSGALATERTHDIVVDDYFSLSTITHVATSADGRRGVYEDMRWDEAIDGRNTDLWAVQAGTAARRLTFDDARDHAPAFSADGRWVYFLSGRKGGDGARPPLDGKTQVWRVPFDGGTPQAVTRRPDGVSSFQLVGDRTLVVASSTSRKPDDPFAKLRSEHKSLQYGSADGLETHELIGIDMDTWREESLAKTSRVIRSFRVSPDGRTIAVLSTPDAQLVSNEGWSELDFVSMDAGTWSRVDSRRWRDEAPSRFGWLTGLAWSSDSRALATSVEFDGYPGETFAVLVGEGPASDATVTRLPRPTDAHTAGGGVLAWISGTHTLCQLVDVRASVRGLCIPDIRGSSTGKPYYMTPEGWEAHDLALPSDKGPAWFIASGADHPPDVFSTDASASGKPSRLTRANPQVDTWKLPQIQTVTWKSKDGAPVEGVLELPAGWKQGDAPLPLVLEIHGGPTASTNRAFRFWIYGRTAFAAKGFALLSPNYRGSKGYGDAFMLQLVGRENDIEVADLLTGVDALVERGIADPDRMVVMGWSNGGFLTNAVITQTQRFRAASSGAGIFDFAMQWSTQDTPGHQVNFQKGLPWETPELYRAASPLFRAGDIATPTLIHVGDSDPRTPPPHSRGLFRALSRYLNVPTELVIYPGAGHGLATYAHRKAKMAWDHAWFDHWLSRERWGGVRLQ